MGGERIYFLVMFYLLSVEGQKPNILLIIVDDLRPALGCYGDPVAVTHNIDALASKGIVFKNAHAQQSLCGPSRTSFLTSRRPDSLKLIDVHYYWRKQAGNFTTLPQYFKDHQYFTMAAGKVFHPGIVSNNNDDMPYSWSEAPYHPQTEMFKDSPVCLSSDGSLRSNIYCPISVNEQPRGTLPDLETLNFTLNWLSEKNVSRSDTEKQPFFLAVGFHKPHIPLKFPRKYLDFFPVHLMPLPSSSHRPAGLPEVAWNPWNDLRRREDISALNLSFPYEAIPNEYARYIKQGYYASVTYVDELIGTLTRHVWRLFPNTVVALIGDHGWSLGEHGEWSKFSNFDIATHVPFIISFGPNVNRNLYNKNKDQSVRGYPRDERKLSQFGAPVELLDLFPTLVDIVGLKTLPKCSLSNPAAVACTDGISLYPIIEKLTLCKDSNMLTKTVPKSPKMLRDKKINFIYTAMSQYPRPTFEPSRVPDSDQPRLTETNIMGYSLRSSRYRYTVWIGFNHTAYRPDWTTIYAQELYDHKVDCGENHNVVGISKYKIMVLKLHGLVKSKSDLYVL